MKKILIIFYVLFVTNLFAQGNFNGGYEGNLQYYQNDKETNILAPKDMLRSMNYLTGRFSYGNFTAGLQYEAFLPQAFLGYNPDIKGNGLATYFINYKKDNLDVTAGYFYENFGSGLVFRAWEDKQLGINNAVKGLRVKYNFDNYFDITTFFGNQRIGFNVAEPTVYAANTEINLDKVLKLKNFSVKSGFSYVARYQETQSSNENLQPIIGNYSSRLGINIGNFYSDFEYVYKETDARVSNNVLLDQVLFDGNAWLLNFGYSKRGLGMNATVRRLENIQMYTDRMLEGNTYNTGVMNFIPGLSKQHDFTLANIYVYQAQPSISFGEEKVGEIGGQFDLFYKIKRKTFLGGKYGAKLALNFSRWHGLNANFDHDKKIYRTDFAKPGELYFQDVNFELRKKISKKIRTMFSFVNLKYNKLKLEGEGEMVHANIAVADFEFILPKSKSMRFELQHLSTKQDMKNWLGGLFELNINRSMNVYFADMYNYGNDDKKTHYFNIGTTYTKSSTRMTLNYGRQRGGLLCVGGVCRFVPPSKGVTLSLSTSF